MMRRPIADLQRRPAIRTPKRRFILYCEGRKTEPGYFAALQAAGHFQIPEHAVWWVGLWRDAGGCRPAGSSVGAEAGGRVARGGAPMIDQATVAAVSSQLSRRML